MLPSRVHGTFPLPKIISAFLRSMGLSISKFISKPKRKSPKSKARKKAALPASNSAAKNNRDTDEGNRANRGANADGVSISSQVCTYNGGSDQWRCVHRKASTVKDLYNNTWDSYWVNDMPYVNNKNNNLPEKSQKSQKSQKSRARK